MNIRMDRYKKMSLENRKDHIKTRISLMKCTRKKQDKIIGQEASFYTCRKASMTIEATIVIPLGMGVLLMLLFFFRILFIQAAVEEAIVYAGQMTAVESCLWDKEEQLLLSAETKLKYKLLQEENVKRYVTGGILGISLLGSEISENEITLRANYILKFPIEFLGKKGIWLTSENTFVKWRGDLYGGTENELWVYITKNGSVYHKNTACRSLDLHIQEGKRSDMPQIRGANGQKYYACKRCITSASESYLVYYTDYGKLYHGDLSCSALKRTISKVLLTEVEDRHPCSFCYR